MIKTERFSHIDSIPSFGFVRCPSCRTSVSVDSKVCPCCGEIVDYNRNRNVLLNWKIDLFNYRIDNIRDGLVSYSSPYVGDNYHNFYSLETHRNVIPVEFISFDIRYHSPGAFIINKWIDGKRSLFGLLDKEGNTILSPICEEIGDVDERGNYIVKYKGKTGINNLLNQSIVPLEYDSIKRASLLDKDYFIVEQSGQFGLIDIQNNPIVPIEFDAIGERGNGPIPVCRQGMWGFYDIDKQRVVIPFKYSKAEPFRGNCAKVYLYNTELFIDREGYPSLPESYGEKKDILGGRLVIRDINGNVLNKKLFDPVQGGITIKNFRVGDKEGATTPDGTFVIPPVYDELFPEKSGLIAAKKNDKWGVISTEGEIILPFEYTQTIISEGLIQCTGFKDPNARFSFIQMGYVNRYGETIIPFEYASLSGFYEGLCWYEDLGGHVGGIMDKFGNYVEYKGVAKDGKWVTL